MSRWEIACQIISIWCQSSIVLYPRQVVRLSHRPTKSKTCSLGDTSGERTSHRKNRIHCTWKKTCTFKVTWAWAFSWWNTTLEMRWVSGTPQIPQLPWCSADCLESLKFGIGRSRIISHCNPYHNVRLLSSTTLDETLREKTSYKVHIRLCSPDCSRTHLRRWLGANQHAFCYVGEPIVTGGVGGTTSRYPVQRNPWPTV